MRILFRKLALLAYKFFTIILLINYTNVAICSQTFYSISDGNWSDGTIWSYTSGGSPANSSPGKNDLINIAGHHIILDEDMSNQPGIELVITQDGSLTSADNESILIRAQGEFLVQGTIEVYNLELKNGSFPDVDGFIHVDNSFTNKGDISGNGQITSPFFAGKGSVFNITPTDSMPDGSTVAGWTWTGEVDTDWNNISNWAIACTPEDSCRVAIVSWSSGYQPTISSQTNCSDLTINSGATLHISENASLSVNNAINNEGTLVLTSSDTSTASLIVQGNASGNITVERYVDEISRADTWHYLSAPVTGTPIDSSWMTDNNIALTGDQYQFYRWDEDTDYWIHYDYSGSEPENFADTSFVDGRAYAVTRNGAGKIVFTGTLRTSDISYPASYTADKGCGWNLVGNPFASSIGVTDTAASNGKFLSDNSSLLDDNWEALFLWDEQSGYTWNRDDYKTISNAFISGYSSLDQDYIQPGQGFMVKTNPGGGNLQFNADMRFHSNNSFHKNVEQAWPTFELAVDGEGTGNITAIGFFEGMSLGLDPSFDVGKLKGNPNISLYTRLVDDNGVDFAIQSLPAFEEDYSIPLGLDIANPGEYTFEAVTIDKIPEDVQIYLEDKNTGVVCDLKKRDHYVCQLEEAGSITDRFVLHFTLTPYGACENGFTKDTIGVRSHNNILIVNNPGELKGNMIIFNLQGQLILEEKLNKNISQKISLNVPAAYYIIKIITKHKVISSKIFIE